MMTQVKSTRPRALKNKGLRKREQILSAAVAMLIAGGAGDLTMRTLAARLEMSLGNLQYYFASKEDLIDALVASLCADYEARLLASIPPGQPAEARLAAFADFMLADIATPEGSVVFWELWAMSAHNRRVAEAVNRMHALEHETIRALVQGISPELTGVQLDVRATLVAAVLEGLSVFAGPGRCQADNHRAIGAELRSAVLRLARS